MEPASSFNFANYRRAKETASTAVSEATNEEALEEQTEDNDHVYRYVAMREPDPAMDAQV